ncbi:hypothetical protein N0V90_000802 [Kalmusia sp. IMI 367209]|nr:hypothetical protein N0V90_000802 [Kalmusia sp. IMI 367209]
MKTISYAALALSCLVASTIAAPTPRASLEEVTGIIGSITNPSAGNGNNIVGNGQNNGNGNGNGNAIGNGNGDGNGVGNGNQGGNYNVINLGGLKQRDVVEELEPSLSGVVGSVTKPSAGDGNTITGNGNGNGNGNGSGNSAGNGNGNGNSAGNGNQALNGNVVNLGSF